MPRLVLHGADEAKFRTVVEQEHVNATVAASCRRAGCGGSLGSLFTTGGVQVEGKTLTVVRATRLGGKTTTVALLGHHAVVEVLLARQGTETRVDGHGDTCSLGGSNQTLPRTS